VGLSFMVYKGAEHMFSPDVHFDRSRRAADAWDGKFDTREGDKWHARVAKHYRHKDVRRRRRRLALAQRG